MFVSSGFNGRARGLATKALKVRWLRGMVLGITLFVAAGCGGGGGSSRPAPPNNPPPSTPAPPTAAQLQQASTLASQATTGATYADIVAMAEAGP